MQIWFAIFDLEAGAVNDVPQDATAYAHRDALVRLSSNPTFLGLLFSWLTLRTVLPANVRSQHRHALQHDDRLRYRDERENHRLHARSLLWRLCGLRRVRAFI
jgi:hypothetical protein